MSGRTVSLGCEIIPGFDFGLTPPPDSTSPRDCTPGAVPDGLDGFRDFGGGLEGRIAPVPPLPPDLAAVSDYYEFGLVVNAPIVGFALPLTEEITDPSTIGFYSYIDGEWQRIADVKALLGMRAEGEFGSIPPNLAVLREAP